MSTLILFYHSISQNQDGRVDPSIVVRPEYFEQQLQYFAEQWRVISLAECVDAIREGYSLPSNSLVLTFDDGYRDNLTIAAPLLQRYNLPATFFLATGYIGTGKIKWEDQLSYIVNNTACPRLWITSAGGTQSFLIRKDADRGHVYNQLAFILGRMAAHERDQHLRQIQEQAAISDEQMPGNLMLSWDDARQLASTPGTTIGCHTVSHRRLSTLTDEETYREINDSRCVIEAELGIKVRFLSYPYGTWEDIDRRTIRIAGECGLDGAVTTLYRRNNSRSERFALGRVLGADTVGARFRMGTLIRGSWLGEPLRQISRLTRPMF